MDSKEYFRKKAKKRHQAVKSQIKRLEKMRLEGVERPQKEPRVSLNLSALEKGGRHLLQADGISKSFNEILFVDSSFYINRGEKVGVLGPNGCGKTTLLHVILEEEGIDRGKIFLSESARAAYVSQ